MVSNNNALDMYMLDIQILINNKPFKFDIRMERSPTLKHVLRYLVNVEVSLLQIEFARDWTLTMLTRYCFMSQYHCTVISL